MSVIGIDFGNETCKVCVLKKGTIETVLNDASKRKNPTIISFQGKRRLIAEQASSVAMNNYKNTIVNVKRIIGKEWSDIEAQVEIKSMPNSNNFLQLGTQGDQNGIGCKVMFNDEELVLSATEIASMILGKLKDTTETWLEGSREVKDCVISVPGYFTDAQRNSILSAARIAGLNPLALLNEHMATALDFGIWKSARNLFDTKKNQHHMFVEIGHSSSSVCIAGFIQGQLKMLSYAYDRNLGGRAVDDALVNHFAEEFSKKYRGLDPRKNPKSAMKLSIACEKAKCTLTPEGVSVAPLNVECLMEEQDFNTKLTLDDFEKIVDPLLPRLDAMIEKAKKESGINEFASIEIVGGAARVRAFKRRVAQVTGVFDATKPNYGLSTTMDMDESVARGCALRCAMLSPSVRVKEFAISDVLPYSIRLSWDPVTSEASSANDSAASASSESNESSAVDTSKNSILLFDRNSEVPKTRRLTLKRSQDFEITAEYDISNEALLPTGSVRLIGKFSIGNLTKLLAGKKFGNVRVDFRVDQSGILHIESCVLLEDVEVENIVTKKMKKEEADALVAAGTGVILSQPPIVPSKTPLPAGATEEANGDSKMEVDGSTPDRPATAPALSTPDGEVTVQVKEMKKKTTKTDLSVKEELFKMMFPADIIAATKKQQDFVTNDRIIKETLDTRNKLESLIYSYRDQLDGEYKPYSNDEEATFAKAEIEKYENWLYDEGSDVSKDIYESKISDLGRIFEKIEFRFNEHQSRTKAANELSSKIEQYISIANSADEKYAHIDQTERDSVRSACETAQKWLHEKMEAQGSLALNIDPVLSTGTINDKIDDLRKICKPIVDKKPPTPAPPTPSTTPPNMNGDANNNTSSSTSNQQEEKQQEKQQNTETNQQDNTSTAPMDLD